MKILRALLLLLFLTATSTSWAQFFIENKGQWPEKVFFRAELPEAFIYVESNGVFVDLRSPSEHVHGCDSRNLNKQKAHAYRMILGENLQAQGSKFRNGYYNFFLGDDPSKWASHARAFDEVVYPEVKPGIDARFYFYGGHLKYDMVVRPGADSQAIQIAYQGVRPKLNQQGELLLNNSVNPITELRPYAYQETKNGLIEINSSYKLNKNLLSFDIGEYDPSLELIIDPILRFSTFSGSNANNFGYTATYDQAGFLYSGSSVFNPGYPTTEGAYDPEFNGGTVDIAISKFDTSGTFLVYSTYIGGNGNELAHSIIVNEQDELYLFGTSGSSNYPVSIDAFDQSFSGGTSINFSGFGFNHDDGTDIIISKLNYLGTELLASTFVGGTQNDGVNTADATRYNYADELRGEIELDANGNVLVSTCTNSNEIDHNFPISENAVQPSFNGGNQDGVLFSMNTNLDQMLWCTYFGGSGDDVTLSVATNDNGDLIIAGGTNSLDLPVSSGALFSSFQGGETDAWAAVLNADASEVLACTYWGTETYDQAFMCELDGQGNIHLLGQTLAGDDFIINADYSVTNAGQFISKLSPELDDVIWSTAFGSGDGDPDISPTAFLVDLCDRIYLSGWGGPTGPGNLSTTGLPITSDAFQETTDGGDFYLMAIADDGSNLDYATYYGGNQSNEHVDGGTSRFDRKGKVYQAVCAGCQGNSDFPISPNNAHSPTNGSGGCNLGVFKMDFELPIVLSDFSLPSVCLPDSAHFINTSVGGIDFFWDFGDGSSSNEEEPSHLYSAPGLYEVQLIISDPLTCNLADTLVQEVFIFDSSDVLLEDKLACPGDTVQLGFPALPVAGLNYSWSPTSSLSNPNTPDPTAILNGSTQFTLTVENEACSSTVQQYVEIEDLPLSIIPDTIICDGSSLTLSSSTNGEADSYAWSLTDDFSSIISTDSILEVTPLFSDTYYLAVEKLCRKEGQVTVSLFSDFISLSPNQFVCAHDLVALSVSNSSSEFDLQVDWSPDSPILTGQGSSEISMSTDEDVWMSAQVLGSNGCTLTDSILVEVSPLSFIEPEASATPSSIPQGDESQLQVVPLGNYQYMWTPSTGLNAPDSPSPIASPSSTTTYTVSLTDENSNGSCSRNDTVTVKVFEFLCGFPTTFVPNAFSPNSDGNNDILYVRGNYISSFDLKIYDRWGEMVFGSTELDRGWDGTFRGKELEPAVYVYHLDVTCLDGERNLEKGNITLIR